MGQSLHGHSRQGTTVSLRPQRAVEKTSTSGLGWRSGRRRASSGKTGAGEARAVREVVRRRVKMARETMVMFWGS